MGHHGGMRSRRLTSLVCVLALLVAACAGSSDPDEGPGSVGADVHVDGGGTTTAPSGEGGGSSTPAPPSGSDRAGPLPAGPSGGEPSAPATTAAREPEGPAERPWLGGPGSYARRLLRPTPATAVALEVIQQEGAAPLPGSLAHVRRRVADVSGKPVTLAGPVTIGGGGKDWSADELRAAADDASTTSHTPERAVVRMLFLEGTFAGNDQVLGVAVRGDVMAVFTERVARSSTVLVPRSTLEKAVTLHEMGHILGLVGLVVNADRQDPDHPGHSSNRESVMFWAVESSLVGQVLGGPPPTEFDADDLADLATIRRGG